MDGHDPFFSESSEQSLVKASIVTDYFYAWAKVITPTAKGGSGRIAYIDLFAGPGRYTDGTKSTPLMVIERAIADPDMREMLVAVLNDADATHAKTCEAAIKALPGVDTLRYEPKVYTSEVGEETAKLFAGKQLVPSFAFIDPWGYKGLSLPLIRALLKDWGCDCVFFFNYNRINMGLANAVVDGHMRLMFGDARLIGLQARVRELSPGEREDAIMDALAAGLRDLGGKYVLTFRFRRETGRVSHHLVFVTKHFRGYEIMKDIMARHSSSTHDGVASFEHDPRGQTEFPFESPIDELKSDLLHRCGGQRLTVRQVFEVHSFGRPYLLRNYKEALKRLEAEGKVWVDPPAAQRLKRKGEVTLADSAVVTFPPPRLARLPASHPTRGHPESARLPSASGHPTA